MISTIFASLLILSPYMVLRLYLQRAPKNFIDIRSESATSTAPVLLLSGLGFLTNDDLLGALTIISGLVHSVPHPAIRPRLRNRE